MGITVSSILGFLGLEWEKLLSLAMVIISAMVLLREACRKEGSSSEELVISRSISLSRSRKEEDPLEELVSSRSCSLSRPRKKDDTFEELVRSRSCSLSRKKDDPSEELVSSRSSSLSRKKDDPFEELVSSRSSSLTRKKDDPFEELVSSRSSSLTRQKDDTFEELVSSRSSSLSRKKDETFEGLVSSRSSSLSRKKDETFEELVSSRSCKLSKYEFISEKCKEGFIEIPKSSSMVIWESALKSLSDLQIGSSKQTEIEDRDREFSFCFRFSKNSPPDLPDAVQIAETDAVGGRHGIEGHLAGDGGEAEESQTDGVNIGHGSEGQFDGVDEGRFAGEDNAGKVQTDDVDDSPGDEGQLAGDDESEKVETDDVGDGRRKDGHVVKEDESEKIETDEFWEGHGNEGQFAREDEAGNVKTDDVDDGHGDERSMTKVKIDDVGDSHANEGQLIEDYKSEKDEFNDVSGGHGNESRLHGEDEAGKVEFNGDGHGDDEAWKVETGDNYGNEGQYVGDEESSAEWTYWEDEDEDDDDFMEEDDIIEMMKAEARRARAAGALPAISEDADEFPVKLSELPRMPPPPKEDPAAALRQLYRTYRLRMRKLDVLSYQKLSAMGLLELRGTTKPASNSRFWRRSRRCGDAQSERLAKEIQSDLESVYVGQICLSWEILHWQYLRARDTSGFSFRESAGEFLQFHVLIQRFLEDELFQGPRLLFYARTRSHLRSLLLQVPLLREDSKKKTRRREDEDEAEFSIERLELVIEGAIRIFWEFIRSEKNKSMGVIERLLAAPLRLQDQADQELAVSVQNLLKQKKSEVKEEVKAGACLIKKLSGKRRSNQDDLFFAQVDLKLVARVLAMGVVTRDRLLWCLWKLRKINSVERKISREASFSLFPG